MKSTFYFYKIGIFFIILSILFSYMDFINLGFFTSGVSSVFILIPISYSLLR